MVVINLDIIKKDNTDKKEETLICEEIQLDKTGECKRVVESLHSKVGAFASTVRIAADSLEAETGIIPDMYEAFYGEESDSENFYDRIIIIDTKNDSKEEVKNLLEDYKKRISRDRSKVDEAKILSAKIGEYNNYVFFSLADNISIAFSEDNIQKNYSQLNLDIINKMAKELDETALKDINAVIK